MENKSILPYEYWESQIPIWKKIFVEAKPFPHLVIDDFLPVDLAHGLLAEFPDLKVGRWDHYFNFNTKKLANKDAGSFGPVAKALIVELNSSNFLGLLGEVTQVNNLMADDNLEGGGFHQIERGGHLNIHADFTVHPHRRDWERRLNLILYLNKNWKEEYGGHLELWDRAMKQAVQKVLPVFNRCVIFMTGKYSFHGHPEPLTCPHGESRKSLALYYFSPSQGYYEERATTFQARPVDSFFKTMRIGLDNKLLGVYDLAKRTFGFDDAVATKILKFFYRRKERDV